MLINSAGQEFCPDCGKTPFCSLWPLTDTQLMGGSGLKDPRWLLSLAGAIGEWLESWNHWLECPQIASLSLAWPSQGSWISSVVTIFFQRKCSKRIRQKLIYFCDLLRIHLVLLLPYSVGQSSPEPAQIQGGRKRLHLLVGKWVDRENMWEGRYFLKIKSGFGKCNLPY